MVSYPYPNQNIVSSILDDVLRSVSAASIPVNRPTAMTAVHQPAQVIFNPPATIVYWRDGTKTVVRCDNDEFSEEFGFAMACMRKIFGTRNAFKAQFKNAYRPYLKKKKEKHTDAVRSSTPMLLSLWIRCCVILLEMTALVSLLDLSPRSNPYFVCVECGCVFQEPKHYIETHGLDTPPYEHFTVCPHCGGAFVEAHCCDCCGEFITADYVVVQDGKRYCEECYSVRNIEDDLAA